jgi:O-antigen/teichoic acid export membrane protein
MTLHRNILANYVGTAVTVAAPILALPFCVALLGPEQFGLLGFVATLQAFLALLESGMTQVAIREFAIRMEPAREQRRSAATLLFGFERVYWMFAGGAGLLTLLSANFIATHWLILGTAAEASGRMAVQGAAALFFVQFPGSLYRAFLAGAQEQVKLNRILIVAVLLRHGGGVGLLMLWPRLEIYLAWQVLIGALDTGARALCAWAVVGLRRRLLRWDRAALQPIWPAVWKLSSAVLLGALTGQLDRIILSKMVPVEQFGYYVIASTLALGVLQSIYPLVQAFSPKIMQANGDLPTLRKINFLLFRLICGVVVSGAIGYVLLGTVILKVWLHNDATAQSVHPLLSVLLIGSAVNAFYHVGYFNWLARGRVDRIMLVNGLSFVVCVLALPVFVRWYGPIGATFGFVAMNLIGLGISLGWCRKLSVAVGAADLKQRAGG